MCHRVTKIDNIFLTNASYAYSLERWMDDLGLRLITMSSQIVAIEEKVVGVRLLGWLVHTGLIRMTQNRPKIAKIAWSNFFRIGF